MSENLRYFSLGRGIVAAILAFSCAGPLGAAARPLAEGVPVRPLPLRFEPNVGQTDRRVRFLSGTPSGEVFLTPREIVLSIHQAGKSEEGKSAVVRLHILDGNPNPRIVGLDPLPGQANYFIGNDPTKWHANVPLFAKVKYADVYPGIDLVAYGNEGNLEYDFQVAPGADPARIAMSVEGADRVGVDAAGDLVMRTAIGEVRQYAPRIYQQEGARRHEIAGGYAMRKDGRVAFRLGRYSAEEPLVIDPQLVYSTYFGGTAETDIHAIAVDAAGFVYVAGDTYAHDFPTKNPVQSTNRHTQSLSAIVTKLSPDGASLVYSTYLGGSDTFAFDAAVGIAIDSSGAAYVTGAAGSSDFPTKGPIPGVGNGIFVTKLSADGSSLVYSSVLGGSGLDNPRGIVLDSTGHAYIFGDTSSSDFPTVHPTQAAPGGGGFRDGFWSIVSVDGSQLLFSTYVGGNNDDDVRQLHVIPQSGDVWLSGITQSSNFAGNDGSPGPYQGFFRRTASTANASRRLEAEGPILFDVDPMLVFGRIFLPEFPGSSKSDVVLYILLTGADLRGENARIPVGMPETIEQSNDIEVFASGGCAVVAPATTCSGSASILTEDASTLTVKSAVNISDHVPRASAVERDSQDAVYMTGIVERIEVFPLVDPIQGSSGGNEDASIVVFAPTTRQIIFSTYLGGSGDDQPNGIALDSQGDVYVAGQTQSSDFPTRNALQPTAPAPNGESIGDGNSFIAKISSGAVQTVPREPVEPARLAPSPTHTLPPRPGD